MKRRMMITTRSPDPVRRRLSWALLTSVVGIAIIPSRRARAANVTIEVWTGPSCSCCHDWIEHLEATGFTVEGHDGGNFEARNRLGMPVRYGSCHSAEVAGYAIEGHVPAPDIHRLLEERPDAVGLAVPAMPRGSPGMDSPAYGGVRDPYDVLLIGRDGSARVYQSYRSGVENPVEAPAEHTGRGMLNSIDRAAGTVSISHDPVASAGWPAMTMTFRLANPDATAELTAGQRVQFRFTTEGGGTVTAIKPAQ